MINLMLGDCLERMKEIESGSVDMILTDPPYEISNSIAIYSGRALNQDGDNYFIWDLADSESFHLEGMGEWDKGFLNKKIWVKGELIQFIDGKSMITDWEIIKTKPLGK